MTRDTFHKHVRLVMVVELRRDAKHAVEPARSTTPSLNPIATYARERNIFSRIALYVMASLQY